MVVLAFALPILAWPLFSTRTALGLACGCLIACFNFLWLKRGVEALADRVVGEGKAPGGKGVVARFLLRYVLMAIGAYVILSVSPRSRHRVRSRLRAVRRRGARSLTSLQSSISAVSKKGVHALASGIKAATCGGPTTTGEALAGGGRPATND